MRISNRTILLLQSSGKGLIFAGAALATLLASGCKQTSTAGPKSGPPEVSTVTIQPQSTLLTTELPGRISAFLVAEIRPQVNGLLQKRLFQEGAMVKEGELLYQIDPAPYEAVHNQAKASLITAEAELVTAEANIPAIRLRVERLKGLVATNAVAKQDYDDACASLRQAEANLAARKAAVEISRAAVESARINLSYTPIRAPISGRIGISNVTVGAMLAAYQPQALAVIQQLDQVYVDVAQSNVELLNLRKRLANGDLKQRGVLQNKVKLWLEDKSPYPLEGSLQFRDVTVDPTTGSFTLRLVFSNPKQVLLPGMFVRAVIQEGVNENAILAPQQGVTRDVKGNAIAWVVNGQEVVEQRLITLDRAIGDKWLVTSGLCAGDRVIVEGLQRVRPGVQVRAVPFTVPAPKGGPNV